MRLTPMQQAIALLVGCAALAVGWFAMLMRKAHEWRGSGAADEELEDVVDAVDLTGTRARDQKQEEQT